MLDIMDFSESTLNLRGYVMELHEQDLDGLLLGLE